MQNQAKSSVTAGILGVFLGGVGGHDWYLNNTKKAITHVSLFVGGIILLMLGTIFQNITKDIPALYPLSICVVVLAYAIIISDCVWGIIEGIMIIIQGDAGLAAKGYQIAAPAVTQPMNVTTPTAAADDSQASAVIAQATANKSETAQSASTPTTPAAASETPASPATSDTTPATTTSEPTPASTSKATPTTAPLDPNNEPINNTTIPDPAKTEAAADTATDTTVATAETPAPKPTADTAPATPTDVPKAPTTDTTPSDTSTPDSAKVITMDTTPTSGTPTPTDTSKPESTASPSSQPAAESTPAVTDFTTPKPPVNPLA